MASTWNGETRIAVTRYTGSGTTPGRHRVRFQIDVPRNEAADRLSVIQSIFHLTMDEAIELSMLLIKATHDYRGEHD